MKRNDEIVKNLIGNNNEVSESKSCNDIPREKKASLKQ